MAGSTRSADGSTHTGFPAGFRSFDLSPSKPQAKTSSPKPPNAVMAAAPALTRSFPVDRLQDKPSPVVLAGLPRRCSRNAERAALCRQVCDRIHVVHDAVAELDPSDPIKRKYIDILVRFINLTNRNTLLLRLATSHSTQYRVRELHRDLDTVALAVGSTDVSQWQGDWAAASEELRANLVSVISQSSDRVLVNEVGDQKKIDEVFLKLSAQLDTNEPAEFLQFKTDVRDRIRSYVDAASLEIFDWFVPRESVEIDKEGWIGEGTFGDVWHGTLFLRNGDAQKVVVKQFLSEISGDAKASDLFLQQLQFWDGIMSNPDIPKTNILKLYGAAHVGKSKLYICEDAVNGNLVNFLGQDENKSLFFKMFGQVADGLRVLHARGIVHGGLKCSNVLVGEGNTAKLSDFGFSFVRSLSIELSASTNNKNKAMAQSVRWKPKEMLQETACKSLDFASDVYALGMCMIEAITQEPPFGWLTDDEILPIIMSGAGNPRPDGVADATWEVISQLCHPNYRLRPTIDQAAEMIRELGASTADETSAAAALMQKLFESDIPSLGGDADAQEEAFALLVHELKQNKSAYTKQQREFLNDVLNRLAGLSSVGTSVDATWFILRNDVQVDDVAFRRGSFGKIYHGKYMNAIVAIKSIDIKSESDQEDFLRKVNVWYEASRHPNIVPFFGACHVGEPCFIVSKHIAGGTLPDYLYRHKNERRLKAWQALLGVVHGVQRLHSKGIVHGDLKGNKILMEGDTAMLTGFSMSFFESGSQPQFDNLGALRWRAPEFIATKIASFETDVYSLGM